MRKTLIHARRAAVEYDALFGGGLDIERFEEILEGEAEWLSLDDIEELEAAEIISAGESAALFNV